MLNLLIKDFKLMFVRQKSLAKRIVSGLLTAIFLVCFVVLETFLFSAVLGKIKNYNHAPEAFMTIFLAVISVLLCVSAIFKARKLFFNEKDIEQLSNYPVSNSQIIFSKLIFLFLSHYATSFMFVFPLFIAYGSIFTKPMIFYYLAVFYPALAFFFEVGVALLLVYPVWLAGQYLRKHIVLEFLLALILLLLGTYAYSTVLNMFIDLVANNQLSSLFTTESIAAFIQIERYVIPTNFLTDVFIAKQTSSLFPFILIAVGLFVLGTAITVFTFHHVRNVSVSVNGVHRERKFKHMSPVKALIKKELSLLTKNANYIFSFSGLLVVQPFLLYLVVSAMNTIFSSGSFLYYVSLVPNFVTLVDFLVILMFTLIINQGANNYISMEERTIKNMKTIPVSYKTQLLIKMLIPFSMSFVSLLASLAVLVAFGAITINSGLIALLLATVCLFMFDIVSLREELHIRHGKARSTFLSSVYTYLFPIAYVISGIVLSYLGTSLLAIYGGGLLILVLFGLPHIIYVYQNMGSLFMDLEAIN